MDGRTVQRMRLLEQSNAELTTQNTYLSAQLLQMADRLEQATKQSYLDRLLTAALLARFADVAGDDPTVLARAEMLVANVDLLRDLMSRPPGLSVHTTKDHEGATWVIELKINPPSEIVIKDCSACHQDHVGPETRELTDEERTSGFVWAARCPTTGAEILATMNEVPREPTTPVGLSRIITPERPRIEVMR